MKRKHGTGETHVQLGLSRNRLSLAIYGSFSFDWENLFGRRIKLALFFLHFFLVRGWVPCFFIVFPAVFINFPIVFASFPALFLHFPEAKNQKPEGKGMKKTHLKMKKLKPMEK